MKDRPRPRGILRWLLRLPPHLYRGVFARLMGPRMLLLITTGRRTKRPRTCALNYAQEGPTVYVVSGFGVRTDWYRNLAADPHVGVRIGERAWRAVASTVTDLEARHRALRLMRTTALRQGPPAALRPVFSRLGLDYDAELTVFDDDAPGMPVVALRPA